MKEMNMESIVHVSGAGGPLVITRNECGQFTIMGGGDLVDIDENGNENYDRQKQAIKDYFAAKGWKY